MIVIIRLDQPASHPPRHVAASDFKYGMSRITRSFAVRTFPKMFTCSGPTRKRGLPSASAGSTDLPIIVLD